jgi:riboflavin biosynthesis pyrimidine reductase
VASAERLKAAFTEQIGSHEGIRAALVCDSSGNTSGLTGSSDDLSNKTDRSLLAFLRGASDAAVTSAKTAKAEKLKASRLTDLVVLVGRSGVAHRPELFRENARPVWYLADESRISNLTALGILTSQIIGIGNDRSLTLDPAQCVAALFEHGFRNLLLEAGEQWQRLFLSSGLTSELVLTEISERDVEQPGEYLNPLIAKLGGGKFALKKLLRIDGGYISVWG